MLVIMNKLKRLLSITLVSASVLATSMPLAAAAPRSSTGLRIGYISRNETASAGLYFKYRFNDCFALAPSIDYMFRHRDYDGLMLNVDGHFLLPFSTDRVEFYPLAGVNFSSWSNYKASESDDVSKRVSRLGLNVGAGAAMNVTSTLRLGIEAKFTAVKGYSTAGVTFVIGYNF